MASVRQLASGRWERRVSLGRDPLTGKYRYKSKTADAKDKKEAQRKANAWELELADGSLSGDGGTFGQLCESWIKHKTRRWSPSTLKEHRRIVDRYLASLSDRDVTKIGTKTSTTSTRSSRLAAATAGTGPARVGHVPNMAPGANGRVVLGHHVSAADAIGDILSRRSEAS
jgi:hypothetical protein